MRMLFAFQYLTRFPFSTVHFSGSLANSVTEDGRTGRH